MKDHEMINAEIIADSINNQDVRLTTMQLTFPRYVLAQFNTHRQFSRNSASSRAIPIKTLIDRVENSPVVPKKFAANQKGMQPNNDILLDGKDLWLSASRSATKWARKFKDLGVHKQWSNRILEPFLTVDVVVTATEWDNFFKLRCADDAQDEIRELACMMRDALRNKEAAQLAMANALKIA